MERTKSIAYYDNEDIEVPLDLIHYEDVDFFTLNGIELPAKVVDVYDGDTLTLVVNFRGKLEKFKCRIMGIDTPEIKLPKTETNREHKKLVAKKARNALISMVTNCSIDIDTPYTKNQIREMLRDNTMLPTVTFYDFDKYGRCLIDIGDTSKKMIKLGHANAYDGGTKQSTFNSYSN